MAKFIKVTLVAIFSLILLFSLLISISMIYLLVSGATLHIHPSQEQIYQEREVFVILTVIALIVKAIAISVIIWLAKRIRTK